MAVVKKVTKNKPFRNAHGQYNFTGSINMGTDPVFDDKFTDRDLYSINLGSDVNEAILNYQGTVPISDTSHFTIDELVVKNAGVSYGVKNMKFEVSIVDSALQFENSDGNDVNYNPDIPKTFPTDSKIYSW